MDFEKIKTDFEKRYDRKCEKIYFAGMCIELFSDNANTLSGCLSVGEAMGLSKRDDGRITVQFSGSDSMATFNVEDIDVHQGKRVARLLKNAQSCGVKLSGADIFIFKNSRITDLLEPLILGGLSSFCEKVPRKEVLLPRFENYSVNMITLSGKSKCATLFDGQRASHIPFFNGKCKIVITYTGGEFLTIKKTFKSSFADGVLALKKGDMEKFGALLDKDTEVLLNRNKWEHQEAIFSAIETTKDALGSGIIPSGGVFSLIENDKVDRFIHNLSAYYQKYFGGIPDFYVTDFEDSGIFWAK
jgi:hypothetical protein